MEKEQATRHIIIVGASSGIGRKMAEIYLAKGYRVGITARRQELLQELVQQYPSLAVASSFDIIQADNFKALEELVQRLGGLDTLVISAGIGDPSEDLDWEIEKRTVAVNVSGFVQVENWAFRFFVARG